VYQTCIALRVAGGLGVVERKARYRVDSKELLTAVEGPCQRYGLRCFDVSEKCQRIQFERA